MYLFANKIYKKKLAGIFKMCAEKTRSTFLFRKIYNANAKCWDPEPSLKRGKDHKIPEIPSHVFWCFPFVYCIDECGVCSLRNQPSVIVRDLHSECRLYWKLIASVQSEPHHKCHVEVAGSEAAVTAQSALFHLKVGKTHCDRSALHQ